MTNSTQYRGSDEQEYEIYLEQAEDPKKAGYSWITNKPLKTFEEWSNS